MFFLESRFPVTVLKGIPEQDPCDECKVPGDKGESGGLLGGVGNPLCDAGTHRMTPQGPKSESPNQRLE